MSKVHHIFMVNINYILRNKPERWTLLWQWPLKDKLNENYFLTYGSMDKVFIMARECLHKPKELFKKFAGCMIEKSTYFWNEFKPT